MFEEREKGEFAKKDNQGNTPFITDLHSGKKNKSPYEWIVNNGKDNDGNKKQFKINNIKFFFCAKHNNSGKIESHMWFFKGFCSYVNPKYCQMIDAGTIPLRDSISKVIKYMEVYDRIGGASGEIEVFEPTEKELGYGFKILNDPKKIGELEHRSGDRAKFENFYKTSDGRWFEKTKRN
jgi:cellulose synthase/poly-beta-1,6-N-acetylglucosamine synthase-like glycosyltransferase